MPQQHPAHLNCSLPITPNLSCVVASPTYTLPWHWRPSTGAQLSSGPQPISNCRHCTWIPNFRQRCICIAVHHGVQPS